MTIQELNQEMRDEGIEIGFKKGHEKGRVEGRVEGRAEERAEMIRNVLYQLKSVGQTAKMLKVDIDEVWSVTKSDHISVDDYPN